MNEIYKKLQICREVIKNTKIKKEGWNDYSKYKYFTPDQIEVLVSNTCVDNGLITKFDLKRNEFGETGYLSVIDISTGAIILFEMATAIPVIKATNIAQQLGGCVTYTERYLKMTAFGITENTLDPDTEQNTKKSKTPPEFNQNHESKEDNKPWLNKWNKDKSEVKEYYQKAVKEAKEKGLTVKDLRQHYKISKEIESELNIDLN